MPVLPGKEELDRQTFDEMAEVRREEYEAALKEAGITRQAVWHQEAPNGTTLAVVYIEAGNPDAVQHFTGSDAAISRHPDLGVTSAGLPRRQVGSGPPTER